MARNQTQTATPSVAAQINQANARPVEVQKFLDVHHEKITVAAEAFKSEDKARHVTDGKINAIAEAFNKARGETSWGKFLEGNAKTNIPRQQAAAIFEMVMPGIPEKTRAVYVSSFWACLKNDVAFDRNYARTKAQGKGPATKANKIESATRNDFAKAVAKLHTIAGILAKADKKFADFADVLADAADDVCPEWQKVED